MLCLGDYGRSRDRRLDVEVVGCSHIKRIFFLGVFYFIQMTVQSHERIFERMRVTKYGAFRKKHCPLAKWKWDWSEATIVCVVRIIHSIN